MKIQALISFAGVAITCAEGEVYDLPDDQAKQFIKEGIAVAAEAAKAKPTTAKKTSKK